MRNVEQQIPELLTRTRKLALRLKRRLPSHIDPEDLVGVGNLGIARALAHWQGGEEGAFAAYAMQCAWGAMLDELRRNDPLTRGQRRLAAKLHRAEHQLTQELGRQPEHDEIATELGMSPEDVLDAQARTTRRDRVSLSALGSLSPAADSGPTPEAMLDEVRRAERLRGAMNELPDRLRRVVDLWCDEELTLREIGARLGVTEARACQLRKEAIARLEATCAHPAADDFDAAA
jgi:RNA polymerase sigma factor for flagellar operon FliA